MSNRAYSCCFEITFVKVNGMSALSLHRESTDSDTHSQFLLGTVPPCSFFIGTESVVEYCIIEKEVSVGRKCLLSNLHLPVSP